MSTVKIWTIALAALLVACQFTAEARDIDVSGNRNVAIEKKFSSPAEEDDKGGDDGRSRMGAPQDAARQGLLAQLLVQQTGLYRYLPANPTDAQCFEILAQNGIVPEEGWDAGKVVTRGDLARVIVQGLGIQDEVKNPDDPRSWMDTLASVGITITTIGEAVGNVNPISRPERANPFFGDEDEASNDPQGLSNSDLAYVLRDVFPAVPRQPITPN
jgi:hypothetical protein